VRQGRESSFNELHRPCNGLSASGSKAFTARWRPTDVPSKTHGVRWRPLISLDELHRVCNDVHDVRKTTGAARDVPRSASNARQHVVWRAETRRKRYPSFFLSASPMTAGLPLPFISFITWPTKKPRSCVLPAL